MGLASGVDDPDLGAVDAAEILGVRVILFVRLAVRRDFDQQLLFAAASGAAQDVVAPVTPGASAAAIVVSVHFTKYFMLNWRYAKPAVVAPVGDGWLQGAWRRLRVTFHHASPPGVWRCGPCATQSTKPQAGQRKMS